MKPRSPYTALVAGLALALLLVAFLLRMDHLVARIFHVDEYISMLAAQMTALKGAPILPSGMLYNQGLLTSYLAVPFIWLNSGLSEEMMRWPSLLAGLVTVAGFYLVARRIFSSRAAGLFALAFAALDGPMILWSARMRMYAPAGLFSLFALYFIAQGMVLKPRPAYRLAAMGCLLGAVLSHSVAVVALPAWVLTAFIVVTIGHRRFKLPFFMVDGISAEMARLAVILVLIVALAVSVIGQVAVSQPDRPGEPGGGPIGFASKFLDPGVSWQRVDDYVYYFTSAAYWPLAALGGLALVCALVPIARRRYTRRDLVTLLLALIFLFTLAELSLVLVSTWRKTRYLFVLCQPAFLLLAADGLACLGDLLPTLLHWRPRDNRAGLPPAWLAPLGVVVGTVLIVGVWGRPVLEGLGARSTGDYDTAFKWVKQQWQAGDRVMTVHPSAAYLYLGRSDYYAAEKRARVLFDEETDAAVDRYVGSALVDSVEALNHVLATAQGRLWFVLDNDRLFHRYGPLFTQQVFAQMDIVHNSGGVPVFLSHAYPRPMPVEPPVTLSANFSGVIDLGGYDVNFAAVAPDGTVPLTLFWRPQTAQIARPFKVFVQVRNARDETVAQADHFILEGLLSQEVLAGLLEAREWLRDSVLLAMPAGGLAPGEYRLLVGLYEPDTFERVPLTADASGENAVLLERLTIP